MCSPAEANDAPLLWMELFDHDAERVAGQLWLPRDRRRIPAFDELVARANNPECPEPTAQGSLESKFFSFLY